MKLYDENSKRVKTNADNKLCKYNMRCEEYCIILHKRIMVSIFINEMIRGINVIEEE